MPYWVIRSALKPACSIEQLSTCPDTALYHCIRSWTALMDVLDAPVSKASNGEDIRSIHDRGCPRILELEAEHTLLTISCRLHAMLGCIHPSLNRFGLRDISYGASIEHGAHG